MASGRTSLFFHNCAALLLAHHPTLSLGRPHTALADYSLSVPRGHSEHSPLSFPDLLRACALSDLPGCPAHYESHSARRSSSRRRHHVGRRFRLLSGSGRPDYHAIAKYAAKGSFKKPQRPVTTLCSSAQTTRRPRPFENRDAGPASGSTPGPNPGL